MSKLTGAVWRKSSRSNGAGGQCVEVADNLPGIVGVRDSKDPEGGTLTFSPARWRAFVTHTGATHAESSQTCGPAPVA